MDTTAPTVSSFNATSPSASLTIPIAAFHSFGRKRRDRLHDHRVRHSTGCRRGWLVGLRLHATYTVGSDGVYTLYPWAKDALGNVSPLFGSPVTVSVDTTAPTVTAFTAPSPSASLTIPISGLYSLGRTSA